MTTPEEPPRSNIERLFELLNAILTSLQIQRNTLNALIAYQLDPSPTTSALLRKLSSKN